MKNSVSLIGRLGKDVEVREVSETFKVASVNIATSYPEKQKDGTYTYPTIWETVKAFNHLATKLAKFKKGDNICVDGEKRIDSYKDKDGNDKTFQYIQATAIYNLNPKSEAKQTEAQKFPEKNEISNSAPIEDVANDSLPF